VTAAGAAPEATVDPATGRPLRGDGAIRRRNPHQPVEENTFAGVLSFMRRLYARDLTGVDLVVSGVPLDLATTARPGTRFGPAAIRAASAEIASTLPYPWGFDPFADLAVIDWGDCWFDPHRPWTVRDAIEAHARTILASGARMLTLGGDHYISYPLLRAHAERFGAPLSLVHFDAHCDTWADDDPSTLHHGTGFYKAVKEGLVDPARSVQIGIRTWNDDFMGFEIVDPRRVESLGVGGTTAAVRRIVGDRPAYLTFDIDVLDPAHAPGTGTPVAGGLTSATALAILGGLDGLDFVGMDVVEVSPPYDPAGITAIAAAHVACDMICLMRLAKLRRREKGA
jgi:agmatinase